MSSSDVIIIVLSDLHFGLDIKQPSIVPTVRFRGWWRLLRPLGRYFRKEFQKSCDSHDDLILRRLDYELHRICGTHSKTDYDQLIVCGDLATISDKDSYRFLRRFFSRITSDSAGIYGLGIKNHREKMLAVPGNHDKLFDNNLSYYSDYYGPRDQWKFCAPAQNGVHLVGRNLGLQKVPFLFALFDSNHYQPPIYPFDPVATPLRTASGKIYASQLAELANKLDTLDRGYPVDDATKEHFREGKRICVMHHPPDLNFYGPKTWMTRGSQGSALGQQLIPHGCENIGQLFDTLQKFHFDLVLTGHMHQSRIYKYNGIPVIGCSTSSQLQTTALRKRSARNALYVLRFDDQGVTHAECYNWDGSSQFALNKNPAKTRRIIPW